jgi:predicted nucleic acid-binding protein
MRYLLDTNVISEHRRPKCDPHVKAFMRHISNTDVSLSTVSIGEIVYGIEKESDTARKEKLSIWLAGLLDLYREKIIPIDIDIVSESGRLRARHRKTLPIMDSLIAATALVHHLTLVTRNIQDFEELSGLTLLNPWDFR